MHQFQLIRSLGRGSGGEAMLAEDLSGEECVLKFVHLEGLPEERCRRALREVHFLHSLTHPNVLRIRTAFLHDFNLVLSSEFCNLGDLQALICKRKELRDQEMVVRRTRCCPPGFSEATVKGMLVQMLSALDYIHAAGIIHRDLKSSNIFLTEKGVAKVGDFGVAEQLSDGAASFADTHAPRMVGSIHYLSPELCEGGRATAAADCWALGVILYELCTLELPFPGNTPLAVAMKILQGVAQPLSSEYSAELRSCCGALLCPAVKHRISVAEASRLPWIRQLRRHEEVKPVPDPMEVLKRSAGSREFERFVMAQIAARSHRAERFEPEPNSDAELWQR